MLGLVATALGSVMGGCGAEQFVGGSPVDSSVDLAPPPGLDALGGSGGMIVPPTDSGGGGTNGGDLGGSGGGTGSGGAPGTGGAGAMNDAGVGADAGGQDVIDASSPDNGGGNDAANLSHPAALTGAHDTMLIGSATGGSQGQESCPAGQALSGFSGSLSMTTTTASVNRQITGQCGIIAIAGTAVTIKAGATLTALGMAGVSPWTRPCPADQVVVGFSGRLGTLVDQLVFVCAPLTASSPTVGTGLMPGTQTSLPGVGGTGGMPFNAVTCALGEVASGLLVRSGTEMDAFSLICSKAAIGP
ncbi:MAG TPA: hypothetical protein VH374_02350 [Polyangia bacterium]|nr:hypothetical protein [Polyangia bacterium]